MEHVRRYRILYPESRAGGSYTVAASVILGWARDFEADDEIEGGFGEDVDEAIRQMEDVGAISVSTEAIWHPPLV